MLLPTKHLDLDRSTIWVSSIVLAALRRRRAVKYDDIVRLILKRTNDDGDVVIGPAINFLFLLGCLRYHAQNDTFEYLEQMEA